MLELIQFSMSASIDLIADYWLSFCLATGSSGLLLVLILGIVLPIVGLIIESNGSLSTASCTPPFGICLRANELSGFPDIVG
jgi:hypothetical protein